MRIAAALSGLAAAAIVAGWAWLGAPVQMPASPFSRVEKIPCISYAPFRGDQNPLGPDIPIDPRQIEEDLVQLKQITDCVRTYSVDHGLHQIPEIARRHGMKVLQGLWLSRLSELNRKQVQLSITLARQFPDVIGAVVVGNEVLLRAEMAPGDLVRTIREVKAQVAMPVTYADVWEFWLRYRDVSAAVDFITVHILPYWEDFPIPAQDAAGHVNLIRKRVAAEFPDKDIFIGEFGWPSAGRMREGALPSPVNQARVMHDVLALARRENFRINLIEAYDQPWKRKLEGTVGGHWGLFDAHRRMAKFTWGGTVSNHPHWRWQAASGVLLAGLILSGALFARRSAKSADHHGLWLRIVLVATVAGGLIGWTIERAPLESLMLGDWLRSIAWLAVASLSPILGVVALVSSARPPAFAQILTRNSQPGCSRIQKFLGVLLIALAVLSAQAALGLVFDPRYRDFPFAPLTAAVLPFVFLADWKLRPKAAAAETAMGITLFVSAIYIMLNEGFANWQACWLGAGLIALAFTLLQAPDAPS